jgi:predicted DNA-binding transcriptional regulator AlpA
MVNVNAPFGFRPVRRLDGELRTPSKRPPTPQVASAAKEAAAIRANASRAKAAALASMPSLTVTNQQESATVPAHRAHDRQRALAPRAHNIRLLDKREILAITNVTFPTIWAWMRAGTFPRSRVVGGKSMWLSTDIEAWLAALPVRQLKGDEPKALERDFPVEP